MTDGDALLRAILEDPGDDLPRLAYADWCDEAGGAARAEFIRWQVRVPSTETNYSKGHPGGAPDGTPDGLAWATRTYHRGFVRRIDVPGMAEFLGNAKAAFSLHPVVEVWVNGLVRDDWWLPERTLWRAGWGPRPGDLKVVHRGLFLAGGAPAWRRVSRWLPRRGSYKLFPDGPAAQASVNGALVAYGRSLAGLPPLGRPANARTARP